MKALLILVVLLAGCAPNSMQALKEKHAGKITFEIDQNYQPVYRTIVTQARKCYQTGMVTAQMMVQSDLYTDLQSGHVSVALHGGFGVDTYFAIDITAIGDGRTAVETFYAFENQKRAAQAVEAWVTDKFEGCAAESSA